MKTQIVQLEPHDDYISVRDRMGWGQTTRVLLVWPLRGSILNRKLDLLLLKRHSETLGSQLALVTRDRDVRYQAGKLEIPVYKNIRKAEQSRWLQPHRRRKNFSAPLSVQIEKDKRSRADLETLRDQAHPASPRWLTHPVFRISFFTLGVLSMLLVAALFIPSAEIYISPIQASDASTISVNASPEHKIMEISGAVPTYWQSVIIEGRGSTPSSGGTIIPRQTASGRVIFTNLTDGDIFVPAGSVVSTQGDAPVRFATREDVTIQTSEGPPLVWVDAILPGSSGNVGAEEIVAIEGPLGLNLTVINPRGTSGGTNFKATAPTEADLQRVYDELLLSLQETALNELKLRLEAGDIMLSEIPVVLQVLEETSTPAIGQPADDLELTLRVEFQIPYAAGEDLYQLSQAVLERQVPEDFSPLPETLTIRQLTPPVSSEAGNATWKIQAAWKLGAKLDESQAVSLVLGLAPEQAIDQLRAKLPVEDDLEIRLTPAWWPGLPILPFRIHLINHPPVEPKTQNANLDQADAER